jgi:hypothetical protein
MSKKIPKGTRKPRTKRRIPANVRKQGPSSRGFPFSHGPKQPINPFNARGKNANFAQRNLGKQMNNAIQNMAREVMALRKEKTTLKAKLAQAQKNPKTK